MSSKAKTIVRGSVLRIIEFFANALIGIILMPFIIRSLGDKMYGLWIFVGSFLGYYGLMDFGLGSAVQRYISRAIGAKDRNEENKVINTALFIFSFIGSAALIISFIVAYVVPLLIKNINEIELFRQVIFILGINFAIGFPLRVFSGILFAHLRYDLHITVELIKVIFRTILIVVLLKRGYGIIALALITFFMDICGYIAKYCLVKHFYKYVILSRGLFDREKVKSLFNYSIYSFITEIANQLRFNVDNLVIITFMGLSNVTLYSIASRLIRYFMNLISAAIGIFAPLFSQYESSNDYSSIRERFILTTKISSYLSIIIGAILIIFGKPFIKSWLGSEYLSAYPILVVLVIPITIDLMQNPSGGLLFGISKHKFLAQLNSIEGIINLILSIVLVKKIGLIGVAFGTAIPMIITKLFIQPVYVCRVIKFSIYKYYFKILIPLILKSVIVVLIFYQLFHSFIVPRYMNLLALISAVFIFFSLIVFFVGFDNSERKYIIKSVSNL